MERAVRDVIVECTNASEEERITFGEVVAKLHRAGVERYHADLVRGEKTYYLPNGESDVVCGGRAGIGISSDFSARDVEAAIKAIQSGRVQYQAFCKSIAEAGCVGYIVSLTGRRAVYYGRTGENHVEWFPPVE